MMARTRLGRGDPPGRNLGSGANATICSVQVHCHLDFQAKHTTTLPLYSQGGQGSPQVQWALVALRLLWFHCNHHSRVFLGVRLALGVPGKRNEG